MRFHFFLLLLIHFHIARIVWNSPVPSTEYEVGNSSSNSSSFEYQIGNSSSIPLEYLMFLYEVFQVLSNDDGKELKHGHNGEFSLLLLFRLSLTHSLTLSVLIFSPLSNLVYDFKL